MLVVLLLLVMMAVYSCVDILEELYVALILVFFGEVLSKSMKPDDEFWMMGTGGNNTSALPDYV